MFHLKVGEVVYRVKFEHMHPMIRDYDADGSLKHSDKMGPPFATRCFILQGPDSSVKDDECDQVAVAKANVPAGTNWSKDTARRAAMSKALLLAFPSWTSLLPGRGMDNSDVVLYKGMRTAFWQKYLDVWSRERKVTVTMTAKEYRAVLDDVLNPAATAVAQGD